ncbi:MAG: translation initiation factor IF-2 [Candidatus Roizmanbacteria bacterium]|nr:translation initiation factor IF-2 [Candidatus Roizmanbacteria bacterium]
MKPRSPIVAILGHVDHGKTTLLDYIRSSRIAAKEQGGITQKIGGYTAKTDIKGYPINEITFIDTPGHEAFSQLRARGANVADIVLLIVDAKDSLMPQTIESISHIKQANVPCIVVLNKMDLPEAKPEKVKNDLLRHGIMVEGKGGTIPVAPISAKTGKGVPELLETILFLATDKELTFDPKAELEAYVIETKKDRRGIAVSIVVKNGTLHVGDVVYAGEVKAKIRSITDDLNAPLTEATASQACELLGFEVAPLVGSRIASKPEDAKIVEPEAPIAKKAFTSQDFFATPQKEQKKLAIVVKTDSQGSLEALEAILSQNSNIDIILSGVGDIHKSDVFLAKASKAIVIGFNTRIDPETKDVAKQEKVIIKSYTIIYELLEELEEVALLLQEKEQSEKNLKGEAKILATFVIEGEKIFGSKLSKGKFELGDMLEIHRAGNIIGKSKIVSLKIRAKKVEEVKKEQECGLILSPALDIRVGDVVKCIL